MISDNAMFFGPTPPIARFDKQTHSIFEKLTQQQLGYFWRPEEVELTVDAKDFKSLPPNEQHIFTSNLKRQIVLDTVQGRSPLTILLPHASLPEVENWITTWGFFETIHSRSYTHIIRNVYPNPSAIFDGIMDISEIIDCSLEINMDYNTFMRDPTKETLWMCLNSINALEGIRFYVSFACSWAFAERKKMEGNAKIIKFIARDENIHLASTQHMLKLLAKEDDDYRVIRERLMPKVEVMFKTAVEQEKDWARYLFQRGPMVGLNYDMVVEYIDWIAAKRMAAIGLPTKKVGQNPLPWTNKWIGGGEVQVAPQETQISSYVVGGVDNDVTQDTFKGFKL